jgi:glycerol dehydrogenase
LHSAFQNSDQLLTTVKFNGECCQEEVERLMKLTMEQRIDVVCGLGGGKTLDTAKLTACDLKKPVVVVPSSASTDAPASAMGVLYHPDGRHLRCQFLDHAPELVLVDSQIIAQAPLRLFAAGIGDALSTWFEAEANRASGSLNYVGSGFRASLAARAIARRCHEALLEDAPKAVDDLAAGRLTEAVENVIEANILLSGLGFENNGCAAAHALHTGIHELPGSERLYHGEVVAFGVVFQLVLEKAEPKFFDEILSFMISLGLPVCFDDLGLSLDDSALEAMSRRIMDGASGIEAEPFAVTEEMVRKGLAEADAVGYKRRRLFDGKTRPAFCREKAGCSD